MKNTLKAVEKVYKIIGTSRYGREELDEAATPEEAAYLVKEYQMAYGKEWAVYALNKSEYKQAATGRKLSRHYKSELKFHLYQARYDINNK